ncbi:WXG100 family type VII secretion target [Gephyromycinifex aptenodytis]|uniref:WXG100 family type VII secretion target n=1 Tax=Gephyromycinifex aptenodytis TaxID=2716227 RepID=UPI001444AC32|nr:WXG100 family type VII secretion target [Gephyromycinifex aptenodytis]
MSIVSYDSAIARDAEAGLAATASALEANLAELGAFVSQVCANWDGDEQVLYRGIQTQWDTAAAEVNAILLQIKTGLGRNTVSVDEMRARVRSALQG